MLVNGILSLVSAIILVFSITKIRHRLPNYLKPSDKILIKLCWLVFARLIIVSLYNIPVYFNLMNPLDYDLRYIFKAYTYVDFITTMIGFGFSFYLYTRYYGNERLT